MRADKKTITFDFDFEYPVEGRLDRARSITVCEPAYDKRDVFRRMQAYVSEAQRGLLKTFADEGLQEAAAKRAEAMPATAEEEDDFDAFRTMRMGLGVDTYPAFADYVQKVLTNTKALAFVGEDDSARVPITDQTWMSLAKAGGMAAIDQVLSEFAGFFFDTPSAKTASATTTGTSSSVPLATAHQASQPTALPARRSRSPGS